MCSFYGVAHVMAARDKVRSFHGVAHVMATRNSTCCAAPTSCRHVTRCAKKLAVVTSSRVQRCVCVLECRIYDIERCFSRTCMLFVWTQKMFQTEYGLHLIRFYVCVELDDDLNHEQNLACTSVAVRYHLLSCICKSSLSRNVLVT